MTNSVDPDQTAPICSGSTLLASKLYSSVMPGNYVQQTTSAMHCFGALRVKISLTLCLLGNFCMFFVVC